MITMRPAEVGVEQRLAAARHGRDDAAAVRARASASAWAVSGSIATGNRSALPIDPRSAFQPNGLALMPAAITPPAPPASATRTMAPTLPGSCTSAAMTTSAELAVDRVPPSWAGRSPMATSWLGDRTGLMASITGAAPATMGMPRLAISSRMATTSDRPTASDETTAWRTGMLAASASDTRWVPSSSNSSGDSPRATSRKRATSGL